MHATEIPKGKPPPTECKHFLDNTVHETIFDNACRISPYNCVCRNIFGDNGASGNNGTISDR